MRNEYRDAAAEKKRIQNREAKPDLMNVPEIEDVYPSEHFILDNEKYPCLIASDWLYDAMLELPKTQREMLILEFWYGYHQYYTGLSAQGLSETYCRSQKGGTK